MMTRLTFRKFISTINRSNGHTIGLFFVKKDYSNFYILLSQDIANSLKKEVESLNEANSNNIKDIKNETEHKISEIQECNEIIQKQHKEEILRLNEKIKQLIEENKILLIEQNENQEEIKILRAKQVSLNATMEKQAKSMENEQNLAKGRIFNLEQKVQDYCTENQLIKEENYNYCSKLFTLEQKLQTITSENLDLKRFQTDFGYQKEQMIKKIDKLYEEKQKIVAELECIKNHPIITELDQVKQQNDILRNVVLEQKHLIIKYNAEKELANQKIMVSSETQTINHISVQTEKKTKELKKHNCIQRNIIAVSNPKQNEAIALSEAEKRIQDLENIVFFLKHILVESATSNINAYCLDK